MNATSSNLYFRNIRENKYFSAQSSSITDFHVNYMSEVIALQIPSLLPYYGGCGELGPIV